MELNNILFSLLLILFGYLLNKYLLLFLNKSKLNLLSDADYKKPQAFHEKKTYRLGGTTYFILLFLSSLYLFKSKNIYLSEYISFCSVFFILGLLDDLKIKILPKFRLFAMTGSLLILVIANELYIQKVGLEFLNYLLEIDIFSLIFIMLCFLFIINGSNLIDGFNGLLGIHTLIIFSILFIINIYFSNLELSYILFFIILSLIIILKFNFPSAKLFFGDSGAYLLGTLTAISIIKTSVINPNISPFFFCILLAYLFFEVFFSFFRKIFVVRQSPLLPDNKHLHMKLYKFLLKKGKSKSSSNYLVSIYINTIYLLLILPAIIFYDDGVFCRYYFFILFIIYIYLYKLVSKKI
tara:strand:+ start:363 stop:1418 length:1056 start_codon:yes stop_codon:yes gene_type:complete